MSIAIHCECGKSFSLPDRFFGRKGNCIECDAEIVVPTTGQEPPAAAPAHASSA